MKLICTNYMCYFIALTITILGTTVADQPEYDDYDDSMVDAMRQHRGRKIVFDETDEPPKPLYNEDDPEIQEGSVEDMKNLQWVMVTSEGYEYEGTFDEVKAMMMEDDDDSVEELDHMLYEMGRDDEPPRRGLDEIEEENSVSDESVFPPDTRVKITTIRYPYTAVGRIDIGCTGSFVRSRSILTAGHCVYNRRSKRWYRNLNIRRGKGCGYHQLGVSHRWKKAISVRGYISWGRRSYDYGMIFYYTSSPAWFGFGWSTYIRCGWSMQMAGYPGDRNNCLYSSSCGLKKKTFTQLKYMCDTYGGMSGSGILFPRYKRYIIHGIHTHAGDNCGGWWKKKPCNGGVRINSTRFKLFKRLISQYN